MAAKKLFRVTKTIIQPGQPPETLTVKGPLTKGQAEGIRDSLNEGTLETFNPDRVVTYLVAPV